MYIGEMVRIGSIIIVHPSKLWKAKFFMLCDVIFLVRLQGKFDTDHFSDLLGSQNHRQREKLMTRVFHPFDKCVSVQNRFLNPFTPKSDQVQISPVASPVILHHTV